ncbi:MAG: hypothetical protein WDN06_04215 [Asticcacaulis sp.]
MSEGVEWLGRALLIVTAAVIMGSGLTGNADLLNGIFRPFWRRRRCARRFQRRHGHQRQPARFFRCLPCLPASA